VLFKKETNGWNRLEEGKTEVRFYRRTSRKVISRLKSIAKKIYGEHLVPIFERRNLGVKFAEGGFL